MAFTMTQHVADLFSMTAVWVGLLTLGAFLVLFWALRGAPVGQAAAQEDDAEEAPNAGYRDRVVAAAIAGLLLIAVGAYVALVVSILWSLPLFAIGFGIVITLVTVNQRYRHASPTLRRVVQFSNTALNAALIGGILIVANVLAFKYGGRPIDFTREEAFSLSPLTIKQIKSLSRPVTFTMFTGSRIVATPLAQLLRLYKAENPSKIEIEEINPFTDLDRFSRLSKRIPDVSVAAEQGGGVVIEYGEGESAERLVLHSEELFEFPRTPESQNNPYRLESSFKGEDTITSALIRLREGKRSIIAITVGHGEPPTENLQRTQPGLGVLKARLTSIGSEVIDLSLAVRDVPEKTSVVLIVAPRSPFQPEEVSRLKSYVAGGGRVLAILGNEAKTGLEDWLANYKVALGRGQIVEPRLNVRGQPFWLVEVLGSVHHPIVDPLARQPVFLPNSAPLSILPAPMEGSTPMNVSERQVVALPLIRTSRESWAETDQTSTRPERDNQKDPAGPFDLGAAVSGSDPLAEPEPGPAKVSPRLVVFSSRDMAENFWVASNPSNLDLIINAIEWLRGRPELQGIAPKQHVSLTLTADPRVRTGLILIPTLIAFLFIVGVGATTYMTRRM
jgi:gliding motility-associatede transport system auxiliary component